MIRRSAALRLLTALVGIPACLAAGWYIYGESLHRKQTPPRTSEPERPAVQVADVSYRTMEERVNLVGRLEPNAQILLRARVAGYIRGLPKDVGESVDAKKTIIELDATSYQQAVAEATATLEVARAQLRVARREEKPAQLLLQQYQRLKEKGNATQQEVENAQAQLDVLAERVKLEERNVDKAETDMKNRRQMLTETQIASPIAGVVAERNVEVGDLANPNDPLIRVVDIAKVRLHVSVIEEDYGKVKVGQSARVGVDAFPGEPFEGKVLRKSPVLDPMTKTGLVEVEVDNPERLLKPGMTARASIVVNSRPNARVVPIAALIKRRSKRMIYVVQGTPPRAVARQVTVGLSDENYVEILGGVDREERVITLGNRLVEAGQSVILVKDQADETLDSKSSLVGGG